MGWGSLQTIQSIHFVPAGSTLLQAEVADDLVVGDGVLFASSAVNITENVLRAMEANFQAAGN